METEMETEMEMGTEMETEMETFNVMVIGTAIPKETQAAAAKWDGQSLALQHQPDATDSTMAIMATIIQMEIIMGIQMSNVFQMGTARVLET